MAPDTAPKEQFNKTLEAQTPEKASDSVPGTSDSANDSPGSVSEIPDSLWVMDRTAAPSSTNREDLVPELDPESLGRILAALVLPGGSLKEKSLAPLLAAKTRTEFLNWLKSSGSGYGFKNGSMSYYIHLVDLQDPDRLHSVINVVIQFISNVLSRAYKDTAWLSALDLLGFTLDRNGPYDTILKKHVLRLLQSADKAIASALSAEVEQYKAGNPLITDALMSGFSGILYDTFIPNFDEVGASAAWLALLCKNMFKKSEAALKKATDDYVRRVTAACTLEALNYVGIVTLFAEYRRLKALRQENGQLANDFVLPSPFVILSAVAARTVHERLIPIQEKLNEFLQLIPLAGGKISEILDMATDAQAVLDTWREINKFPETKLPPATDASVLNLTDQGTGQDGQRDGDGAESDAQAKAKAAKEKAAKAKEAKEKKDRNAIHEACRLTGDCSKYNISRKAGRDHAGASESCAASRRKNGKGACPFHHCLIDIVRCKINPAADDDGLKQCPPASTADGSTSP
ncbi:MAG: hypothetical protein CBB80_006600 [Synechococcus sp. TMED20]|nr:MAG: hypothetical protein CBB80_006600 [Synechococcus sp. TMED20]